MSTTTKRLTRTAIYTLVEGFFKALNDRDFDAALSYVTDDVIYKQPFTGTMRGKEAVRAELAQTYSAFQDMHMPVEDVGIYVSDDHSAAVVTCTMVGTMTGAAMGAAHTGRLMRITAVQVTKFRDGLISEATLVYDSLDAAQQLGLLPGQGSLAMRVLMATELLTTKARQALRI
jgi:steroid delta-isomerase-like uncharacterized protein